MRAGVPSGHNSREACCSWTEQPLEVVWLWHARHRANGCALAVSATLTDSGHVRQSGLSGERAVSRSMRADRTLSLDNLLARRSAYMVDLLTHDLLVSRSNIKQIRAINHRPVHLLVSFYWLILLVLSIKQKHPLPCAFLR